MKKLPAGNKGSKLVIINSKPARFKLSLKSLNLIFDSMKTDPGNLLTESLHLTWILWRNVQERSGKCPGKFLDISGKCPRNAWKKNPGIFPLISKEISGTCPGTFREMSKKLLRTFQEKSHNF